MTGKDNDRTRVLYVEDDPASVILVRRLLESEGFEVLTAPSGLAAIETAVRADLDLILMDINLGDLDGYEVTTRLRSIEQLQDVPIVAVTAATLRGDRERALISGCTGYIAKPIDVDEFPEQVRSFLAGLKEDIPSQEEKTEYLVEYSRKLVDRLETKIRELEAAHADLQRVEKMKSDFILLASHELRTPLTCVYGYVEMLLHNPAIPGDLQEEGSARNLLHRISDAARRLSQVFDEIRNISLIDADLLDLAWEPVSLRSMITKVVDDLREFGSDRDLKFEYKGLKRLPLISGDEKRMSQAFWNLMSNAIKYTPDGGRITITGRRVAEAVHISVEDTGVGIPLEEQERIFDRFYVLEDTDRHHSSKTAFKGGGMGLGLSVARGIIEAHGGRIWVESEGYDEERLPGSTFHVLLPVEGGPPLLSTSASTQEEDCQPPAASRDREP